MLEGQFFPISEYISDICVCVFLIFLSRIVSTVEVLLKPSSTARVDDVRSAVERCSYNTKSTRLFLLPRRILKAFISAISGF